MGKHRPIADNSFRIMHQSTEGTYPVSNNASIFSGACFQVLVGSLSSSAQQCDRQQVCPLLHLVIPCAVSADANPAGPGAIKDLHDFMSRIFALEGELLCPRSCKLEDSEKR